MLRQRFIAISIAAGLCLLGVQPGCETAPGERSSISNVDERNLALEEDAASSADLDVGEEVDRIVHLEWVDVVGVEETGAIDTLVLKAANPKPFDITVMADVECTGFINRSGKRPLAPHTQKLAPGEEASFEIKADSLPIQSIEGASQLIARVKVTVDPSVSDRVWEARTTPFYYRHDATYKTVIAFNDTALIKKYGGILAGSAIERKGSLVVGKILDLTDKVTEIREADVAAPVYDEEGRFQGIVSAESVKIEIDEEGAVLAAEGPKESDMDLPPREEE